MDNWLLTNNLNYALISLKLLCKMVVKQDPPIKPCILLVSFIFGLRRVSLAEYILILRVYFPLVADDVLYNGYCKYCLHPVGDED